MANKKYTINRRDFLKALGVGAVAAGTATMASCSGKKDMTYAVEGKHTGEPPTDKMTYRTNPNTGDKVSLLGYGCMRWPTLTNDQGRATAIDQEAVNRLIDYALDHGVNYFDTAPVYVQGWSEAATGIALARHPRNTYYIATKLSNMSPSTWPLEASKQMFENSLINLQTDYIDYLLLHNVGNPSMEVFRHRFIENGLIDWLFEQKEKGRIRNMGFSYHGDITVFDWLLQLHDEGKYHWDFCQIQMNYVDWLHAEENNPRNKNGVYLYGELEKRGIPVVIMEPLLGGRLSNLPQHVVAHLKQRRPEDSVASWAFRFCGTYPGVLTCLSGMTYMEHLVDNTWTFAPLEELTDEDKDFLEETAQMILTYPTVQCNDCKYCMPCPYGLDIPGILVHYNKCVNEGNVPKSQNDAGYKKMREAYLLGYDRSVPKLRQASHCTGCNQCSPHCPQQINIPRELQRIDKFVESLKQNTL